MKENIAKGAQAIFFGGGDKKSKFVKQWESFHKCKGYL